MPLPVCWSGLCRICRWRLPLADPDLQEDAWERPPAEPAPDAEGSLFEPEGEPLGAAEAAPAPARGPAPRGEPPRAREPAAGEEAKIIQSKDRAKQSSKAGKVNAANQNLDYSKFQRLAAAVDSEARGEVVMLAGREGWNSQINGIYLQDGWLNGRPRLRKRGEPRWLKFNDAGQWMVSKHQDGRPLGEALAAEAVDTPRDIRGMWYVCTEQRGWEPDLAVAACSGLCGHCRAILERPLRCSVCRGIGYCASRCQRADWRFHKRICTRAAPPPEGGAPPEGAQEVAGAGCGEEGEGCEDSGDEAELLRGLAAEARRRQAAGQGLKPEELATGQPARAPPSEPVRLDGAPGVEAVPCNAPLSQWNGAGTWEERNLLPWSRERLASLLAEPPELRAPCGHGSVRVVSIKNIEGLASIGMNRGERRHLFDLSFDVMFEATWISDFKISHGGKVSVVDFTSALGSDSSEDIICGMETSFVDMSEGPLEKRREMLQVAIPPQHRAEIFAAVGGSRERVARGEGLMHLVHRRLRIFAKEFAQQ